MRVKNQWAVLAVVVRRSFCLEPGVKQSFGVLLVLSATFLAEGVAEAQIVLDFDTSGPTSTAELPDFFDVFGFDADFGDNPFWHIDTNDTNVDNNTNALHVTSDGNQLEAWFSRVAILNGGVAFGENVELSADITWDNLGGDANDNAGLYVRFNGDSDVPLENDFYHVRVGVDNGPPSSVTIHKVIGGSQEQLAREIDDPLPVSTGETHNLRVKAETVGDTVEISVWLNDEAVTGMNPFVDDNNPIFGAGRVGVGQETNPSYFDNIVISGPDIVQRAPGDFNGDGTLDLADFNIMVENFNTSDTTFEQGDNNFDRRVDLRDFLEFRALFNAARGGTGGGAAVPEPSSLALMSLAGALLLVVCRRNHRIRPRLA